MKAFEPFPKIGRLARGCTVTEKIDGTNAAVVISALAEEEPWPDDLASHDIIHAWYDAELATDMVMRAGSRTRWLMPGKSTDNFGFAAWVKFNAPDLQKLGPGYHFGEWWGGAIQRGYGITEKRFSLFNVNRWRDGRAERPACCYVVPVLYEGLFDQVQINSALEDLRLYGSRAAPGFMKPEGLIVYHHATKQLFKQTLENDGVPKGESHGG